MLQQANERKLNLALLTREVYVKGPGLIFKGNPKNYLTKIQLLFRLNRGDTEKCSTQHSLNFAGTSDSQLVVRITSCILTLAWRVS